MNVIRTEISVCVIIAILSAQSVSAQTQKRDQSQPAKPGSQIYSTLKAQFRKEYQGDIRMELNDVRAYQADPMYLGMPANRFLVLASARYYDSTGNSIGGGCGIFVFDDSLTTILRTIDIIHDEYFYTIYRVWKDTLVVHGEVLGRDLQPTEKKYKLNFWENYR